MTVVIVTVEMTEKTGIVTAGTTDGMTVTEIAAGTTEIVGIGRLL